MKRTTAAFSADSGSKKLELQKKFGVENQLWSSWRGTVHEIIRGDLDSKADWSAFKQKDKLTDTEAVWYSNTIHQVLWTQIPPPVLKYQRSRRNYVKRKQANRPAGQANSALVPAVPGSASSAPAEPSAVDSDVSSNTSRLTSPYCLPGKPPAVSTLTQNLPPPQPVSPPKEQPAVSPVDSSGATSVIGDTAAAATTASSLLRLHHPPAAFQSGIRPQGPSGWLSSGAVPTPPVPQQVPMHQSAPPAVYYQLGPGHLARSLSPAAPSSSTSLQMSSPPSAIPSRSMLSRATANLELPDQPAEPVAASQTAMKALPTKPSQPSLPSSMEEWRSFLSMPCDEELLRVLDSLDQSSDVCRKS